ncbi:MAG TPA: hypothetical protein VEZ90_15195, partial [Blastocatellia bacterium]|nr:hypothetical protein [Blastocatellia bacterium]
MNSIRTSRVAMRVIREVPTSLRQALAAIGLSGRKLLAATVALVIVHVFPGICFGSYQISPQSGVILDASFGSGGKVVSDLGTDSFATASIIQHDGKIVVAGCTTATTQGLVNVSGSLMARYNSDGTIDTTFGANGVTTITTSGFGVTGIALQSDGKILLVGGINLTLEGAFLGQLTLVRLNANGSLDTSFGTNGLVIDSNGGIGLSVAIQGDGKIVATGTLEGPGPQLLTVNRYNTDGSLDTTFGTGGTVHTSPMLASELVIQKDGKIVLAGQSFATPAVMRLNTDGSPDTGFGTGG